MGGRTETPTHGISGIHDPAVVDIAAYRDQQRAAGVVSASEAATPPPMLGNDAAATSSCAPLSFWGGRVKPETRRRRMSWRELMKRVFAVDVLECPVCRGQMKIIAEITEPKVIKKFLAALDLPTEAPEIERARPPPQVEFGWDDECQLDPAADAEVEITFDGA